MNKAALLFLFLLWLPYSYMQSQCKLDNPYFGAGETISYDMYYKYGMIFTKAENSTLSVTEGSYQGQDGYKMSLQAKSSGAVKTFFTLSDTLISYTTKDIVPLAYNKNAHEGKDYTIEKATYSYSGKGVSIHNINKRNGRLRYDTIVVSPTCAYDMLSIIFYARTLNYDQMKKGDKVTVSFLAGRRMKQMEIEYQGIDKVKANNDQRYNCIKLVLNINDPAFDDKDESMKVFLTNDYNRVPVRIDSKLKVGSTRVVMKSYQGLRN